MQKGKGTEALLRISIIQQLVLLLLVQLFSEKLFCYYTQILFEKQKKHENVFFQEQDAGKSKLKFFLFNSSINELQFFLLLLFLLFLFTLRNSDAILSEQLYKTFSKSFERKFQIISLVWLKEAQERLFLIFFFSYYYVC